MAKKGDWSDQAPKAEGGAFDRLAALRASLPPGPTTATGPVAGATAEVGAVSGKAPRGPERAVVRIERKGRGGKDATIIEQLGLSEAERERWLKELKARLGCGGAVEGEALVLQGDLRQRVEPLLRARGVRRVTVA
jgi:translation initiation factor 1